MNNSLLFSREIGGDNISEAIDDGLEALKLGFDLVWVPDHLVDIQPVFAIYDAWTVLAYLGAKTSKLRLGSGVTDIQRIHPAKTANIVSTLDNLTRGRAVLGIGAGEIMNTVPYGIKWEEKSIRIERLREYLEVIELLWSSSYENPKTFTGKYYTLKQAHLSLPPIHKPRPPIYIGAFSSKAMLRLAGELADGWYPGSVNSVRAFSQKVETIKKSAKGAGRSPDEMDIIASIPTFVCFNESEIALARREAKQAIKREMMTNRYIFKAVGLEKFLDSDAQRELEYQHATPGKEFDRSLELAIQRLSIADEVLERVLDDTMAIGTADQCVSSIERFVRAGATHIFFSNTGGTRENYSRIGECIIPELRSRITG